MIVYPFFYFLRKKQPILVFPMLVKQQGRNSQNLLRNIRKIFETLGSISKVIIHRKLVNYNF